MPPPSLSLSGYYIQIHATYVVVLFRNGELQSFVLCIKTANYCIQSFSQHNTTQNFY
jgi:hypothetical protein